MPESGHEKKPCLAAKEKKRTFLFLQLSTLEEQPTLAVIYLFSNIT